MRKMKKPPAEELRKKKEDPLAEGLQIVVPTGPSGIRLWRKMNDEEVVEYARKVLQENGMSKKVELQKADPGLYTALRTRKLLRRVGFVQKRRKERSWKDMGDEQIIEIAKRLMDENDITGREELSQADPGLYQALRKRELLYYIDFDERERSWKDMSDEQIIEFAKKVMKETGVMTRNELKKIDSGLVSLLYMRRLVGKVGFKGKRKTRSWKNITDDEILKMARRLVREKEMASKQEIKNADTGLYMILWKRGLLDDVGIEEKHRSWRKMSNEEIIDHARKVMEENEITERTELQKYDPGLYSILLRRKLIDHAFAHTDQKKENQARDAVIDALDAFAANDNSSSEDDVA